LTINGFSCKNKNAGDLIKVLIFVVQKDFKDETLSFIRMFLEKWRINYFITSYSKGECTGYHGAVCKPSINTNSVSTNDFDGIVIIDGKGIDEYKLYEYRPFLDIIMLFAKKGKFVCAINNSIKILARANIIKGKKIAVYSDEEAKKLIILFHGVPSDKDIEIADNIFTIKDSSKLDETIPKMFEALGIK
jgi:putative intracellular protease/amidase